MDGLQPRIDVRPEVKIPEDQKYNTYPEFVDGDDWTPDHIPPRSVPRNTGEMSPKT